MTKRIERAAVIGAGTMGAAIAGHLANAGVPVVLLDIVPRELTDEEQAKGLTLDDPAVRNRVAESGRQRLTKMQPAPLFRKEYASRITTGNIEDHANLLTDADWVIEAVVERMDVKKKLYEETIAPNVSDTAVVSSNTSGLSINDMAKAIPEALRHRFLGTHFFNPPRYMRLLEVIPAEETDDAVIDTISRFASDTLGKGIVVAKDTPNFIANRLGVFAMCNAINHMIDMGLTIEAVDAVAGKPTARPKTGVFRLADLVGLDIIAHVAENSYEHLEDDPWRETFKLPDFLKKLVDSGALGDKTGAGFYKKVKEGGEKKILALDYETGEYRERQKPKFASVDTAKRLEEPGKRLGALLSGEDEAAEFARRTMQDTIMYAAYLVGNAADTIVEIDNAMKWGFNWELGPFEMIDAIGIDNLKKLAKATGAKIPEALDSIPSFYRVEDGKKQFFDFASFGFADVPVDDTTYDFTVLKESGAVVESSAAATLYDLDDGILGLELHGKMNAIGGDTLAMVRKSVAKAEEVGRGLVITGRGDNFSVGANLGLLAAAAAEGAFDDIALVVKQFQDATMTIKYAGIPVVSAVHGMTLGGGCEFALHSASIVAHAETYMGLVETGVGLLPAGGGTKELAMRAAMQSKKFDTDPWPFIQKYFKQIGLADVSRSADQLYDFTYLRRGDSITMNRAKLVFDAKRRAIALSANYRPPVKGGTFKAAGRSIGASLVAGLWNWVEGNQISEHDMVIAKAVAHVITGGDVPAGTDVTEDYLLALEREQFLKLTTTKKTLERIGHTLKTGKPLRN